MKNVVFSQGFIDMGSQKDMKTAGKGGLKRGVVLHGEFHSTCTASVPVVSGLDQLCSCLLVTINVLFFTLYSCVLERHHIRICLSVLGLAEVSKLKCALL